MDFEKILFLFVTLLLGVVPIASDIVFAGNLSMYSIGFLVGAVPTYLSFYFACRSKFWEPIRTAKGFYFTMALPAVAILWLIETTAKLPVLDETALELGGFFGICIPLLWYVRVLNSR